MTSGRTTMAFGALAAAGATVAVFSGANVIGHSLGYDLWPMFDNTPPGAIEVPAASPNRPGVNPLLPVANTLTRTSGRTTAPAPVVFRPGLPAAARLPLTEGTTTRRSSSSSSSSSRPSSRSSARRSSGSGSAGRAPAVRLPAPAAVATPAPAATAAPVQSTNYNGSKGTTSTAKSSSGASQNSSAPTTTTTPARTSPGRSGTAPGQQKTAAPAAPQVEARAGNNGVGPAAADKGDDAPQPQAAPSAPGQGK